MPAATFTRVTTASRNGVPTRTALFRAVVLVGALACETPAWAQTAPDYARMVSQDVSAVRAGRVRLNAAQEAQDAALRREETRRLALCNTALEHYIDGKGPAPPAMCDRPGPAEADAPDPAGSSKATR
ncbi:MAG: hypothetical protein ACRDQZ_25240 [Mycobacteriales bacterium]